MAFSQISIFDLPQKKKLQNYILKQQKKNTNIDKNNNYNKLNNNYQAIAIATVYWFAHLLKN